MILDEDFKFRDDLKADTVPIELLTGPYKGVIYRYTATKLEENDAKTGAKLMFDYDFFETGTFTEAKLRKDKKFSFHIGLILNSLILEYVNSPDDNDRKANT